ncbi:MAG: Crp/Fnr family transcriptional regulator [Bacteroidetes bacterium GWF2_42_66]|nr:MAG: Crp/Fnr family transcriptional regulator [Bacteroidetes bacterium GWA2_42_15]OFX99173.1 MAG: Crp/Fnr family transcriptional regulator [Bacteroidetes bacterium GWE2_42_39]OFY40569.1 MAG: Crp/Fnr family transcriptional regulator [Bacteroidetes bacterium GWF2_42_66]HBL74520.1 Crp/Fnr family transcriptional regulator [Prolixibacteraceae bacterium]HCU63530.1 Crp/Fnr family transcriptional regulator [Prolixibacteraceae bacterium]
MLSHEMGIKEILDNPKSIFSLLTPEEKEELQSNISLTNYKKNEFIFKEGDKPSGFLFLVDGKIKIFKEGVGGREQIIRMTKPLGMIGYRALLAGEIHIASAMALEDSIVAYVSIEMLYNRLLRNSDFAGRIIRKLAKELGFSNLRTVTLTQKHIRGRLAESILLLKDKYGFENDGATLKVYMSREDIANLSNMTTSNAIRTLSTFAGEKIIAIDGRKIRILDVHRLERISKLG